MKTDLDQKMADGKSGGGGGDREERKGMGKKGYLSRVSRSSRIFFAISR